MLEMLDTVLALGGEGLMLRHPSAPYRGGRTADLLKVKKFHDDEAIVIRHKPGTGRNAGRMGALICVNRNGVEFGIGTGFSDAQRDHPPKLGSRVTYKYQQLTRDGHGVPRFPVYQRVRPNE